MHDREYRRLQIADLDMIIQMNIDFRDGLISESSASQFLSNPMNWLFACIQDKQIIGFAYGFELNRLDNKGNMLYIHEVSVLPYYQRQGIGNQIFASLKKMCRLMGISKIFLFTQKHNTPACTLYQKAGGEESSDDVTYFFNI